MATVETAYEKGFFAGVSAQEEKIYTELRMYACIPYPEFDVWGNSRTNECARSEFIRGWKHSKSIK